MKKIVLLTALGCSLLTAWRAGAAGAAGVTFTKDIAPIFQQRCEECDRRQTVHQAGSPSSAMTSLMSFQTRRLSPGLRSK